VRDYTVPATITIPPTANLTDAVFDFARSDPDHVAFRRSTGGGWVEVTSREFAEQVAALAKGLAGVGVAPGDRVALMSRTRYEWTLLDYAIWAAGAVTVPVYETSSAEQVAWILGDSEASVALLETSAHATLVQSVRSSLPHLRATHVIDEGAVAALTSAGAGVDDAELAARRANLTPDSLATVIYTSGTTGRPKGCELTHRNLLFDVLTTSEGLSNLFNPQASTLIFLPLAHVFARVIQCGAVMNQTTIGHSPDVKNLLPDLASFAPTFLLAVPRVFEKVYNGAKQKAHVQGKGAIFDRADAVAVAWSQAQDRGGAGLALRAQHALFDRLVYAKLRAALGGRCTAAISGGAPLGARLGHFFRGIGVTVYEGYGLTETTAGSTCNLQRASRIGTVGRPIPGVSVRIADDGEILISGDNIFRGYWRNEAATAEALTEDGWFHTGDLGSLDDGFLTITGRKKEILVTAGGKNVVPAVLEDQLRAHPLVSQCMVVGDGQPFIGALITLDADALPAWAAAHGKPAEAGAAQLRDDPDLRAEIQRAVDEANARVSRAEGVKVFRILERDFTESAGELTPKLSLKRNVVQKEYSDEISAIYA